MLKYCAFTVLATAAASPSVAFWPFSTAEERFVEACVETIKKRLHKPDSFDLMNASSVDRRPATAMEMLGPKPPANNPSAGESYNFLKKLYETGEYEIASISVDYFAESRFGATVHNAVVCEDIIEVGQELEPSRGQGPKIDGQSDLEWKLSNNAKF